MEFETQARGPFGRRVCGGPRDETKSFPIPDFCSRAIVAELSQIYDGVHRSSTALAFFKHLLSSDASDCGKNPSSNSEYDVKNIFGDRCWSGESCWGFSNAYHNLYCGVYSQCKSDLERPNEDSAKISCCKQLWNERVDRYGRAGILDKLRALPRKTFEIPEDEVWHPRLHPAPAEKTSNGSSGSSIGAATAITQIPRLKVAVVRPTTKKTLPLRHPASGSGEEGNNNNDDDDDDDDGAFHTPQNMPSHALDRPFQDRVFSRELLHPPTENQER